MLKSDEHTTRESMRRPRLLPFTAQAASAQIPEVPLTTEGYSVLHQMMRFRWTAWRALPETTRSAIAQEAASVLGEMEQKSGVANPRFSR